MNCQEFWTEMFPLATPPLTAAALAKHEHLAHCPACAARWRSHLALQRGLRAVAGGMSHLAAPPRVEDRLRAAFRAHAGETGGSRSMRARARWIPVSTWAATAAAAVGLFAMAAFLSGGRQPIVGMPAEIETDGGRAVAESGFVPLPNAAQIGPNEEVNLVRVEVPRSAMIALGYDVKPEEASELVLADVMLGNDGLARAVRFLD